MEVDAIDQCGTRMRQLVRDAYEAAWSPDGKQLAFHWPDSSDFCIYTVNRDGSGLKRIALTRGSDNELPTWSPDGKKIFFQTNKRRGNWEIWSMNVDGSDQKLVLADN